MLALSLRRDITVSRQASYLVDIKVPSRLSTAHRIVKRHKLDAPKQSSTSVCKLVRAFSIRFARPLAVVTSRESASRATSAAHRFLIAVPARAAATGDLPLTYSRAHGRHRTSTLNPPTPLEQNQALRRVPPLVLQGSCVFPAAAIHWPSGTPLGLHGVQILLRR